MTDTLTRQPSKLLAEALAIADTLRIGRLYTRVLSEAIAMTDTISVRWRRLLEFIMSGKP